MTKDLFKLTVFVFILGAFAIGATLYLPFNLINWGNLSISHERSVTVQGTAELESQNQIASFTLGFNAVSENKDQAVEEVNQKINAITQSLIDFGINKSDIETQNMSIHQQEENYYEEGRQKFRPGPWRISNSINVTLKDIDRANDLADLIAKSGANNVYGPNFRLDDTSEARLNLLDEAMIDARKKAEIIAKESGKELGEVLSVAEGGSSIGYNPYYAYSARLESGGGGADLMPGSGTIYQTLTVSFELN